MANITKNQARARAREQNLPTISNYCYYSSENYGAHCIRVDIPASSPKKHGITLYYSYNTCVAFRGYISPTCRGLFVRQNIWGNTTGKHLNAIDGGNKKERINGEQFEKLFKKALNNA